MNYNQQAQVFHECSGCSSIIPTGKENPCWTTDGNYIYHQLFCLLCKTIRGRDFSKSYYEWNLDLEKLEIIEVPEFKRYMESRRFSENTKKLTKELEDDWQEKLKKNYNFGVNNPQATIAKNLNKEDKDKKELAKELERVRWGLPKKTEKE